MAQALSERRRQNFSTPFPAVVDHFVVTTAKTITVPAGKTGVVLNTDADVWLSDGTAVIPSGDVTNGTGSFFMAKGLSRFFDVAPAQTLSVISASGTAHVSAEWF